MSTVGTARPAGVYVELAIPVRETIAAGRSAVPFALVDPAGEAGSRFVLTNVVTTEGLKELPGPVVVGGLTTTLYVLPDASATGALMSWLPLLTLVIGLSLTAVGAIVAVSVVRRKFELAALGAEKEALDIALQNSATPKPSSAASQERLHAIMRDTPSAIALFDRDDGCCEILNRSEFLGHPVLELHSTSAFLARSTRPTASRSRSCAVCSARLRGDDVLEATHTLRAADGTARSVHLRCSPLGGTDSHTTLGLFTDVTEAWEREQRESKLEEALRHSQRLDAVGQLAGGSRTTSTTCSPRSRRSRSCSTMRYTTPPPRNTSPQILQATQQRHPPHPAVLVVRRARPHRPGRARRERCRYRHRTDVAAHDR